MEFPGSGEEKAKALVSFDGSKCVLYVSTATVHDLSSGQLAVLILHALAEVCTVSDDVTSPEFVAGVYELLVQCYQNLSTLTATGSNRRTCSRSVPHREHCFRRDHCYQPTEHPDCEHAEHS